MNDELMNDLKEKTLSFVQLLKKSQVYMDYMNYKAFLEGEPELMEKVNAFRKESFDIQVGHKYGYFNAYENLLKLNNDHEDLLSEPMVKSFLSAELELSKMINVIYNTFAEGVDFDMGFLEG